MKTLIMKGKTVDEAVDAACAALGVGREAVEIRVINEGKPGMMGLIGGTEAEVEVVAKGGIGKEAADLLQNVLDKMGFMAMADLAKEEPDSVEIDVKGEDMGRIIGKDGSMLKALEVVVGAMAMKSFGRRIYVRIDAGGYREKRVSVLEKLAGEVAEEVAGSGEPKKLPYLEAADRRAVHMFLKDNPNVTSYSEGEGKDRRMVIAPRK